MRHLRRVLQIVTLVAAMSGLALFVVPVRTSGASAAVDGLSAPVAIPSPAAAGDSVAEEVVVADIFSTTRTPPSHRYTPPEAGGDSTGVAADEATASGASGPAAGAPVLLGTLVTPGGAKALLQFDPATSSRLLAVGERAGGYLVVSIAPREVVLRGSQGRLVLRLPQEERP
jgi:hypothetical protein